MTLGKCPLSIFCSRGTPPIALGRGGVLYERDAYVRTADGAPLLLSHTQTLSVQSCTIPQKLPSDPYRGFSLTRKRTPLEPYRMPMPRVLGGAWKGRRFFMGKVPLQPLQGYLAHKKILQAGGDNAVRAADRLSAGLELPLDRRARLHQLPHQGPPFSLLVYSLDTGPAMSG